MSFDSTSDMYHLIDDLFAYLEIFPNNVQSFIEKFSCFFFTSTREDDDG